MNRELEAELIALREPLFALCRRMTDRVTDAEDALQETLLACLQGLQNYRGDARLATWAWRIAIRTTIRVRSRRRNSPLEVEPSARPHNDTAESRDERRKLDLALAQLSTEHRLVITLFAIEELDAASVAEVLGVAEGTVWSRLHRARARLSELLGTLEF